ncbi:MAG: hypothetical protein GY859_26450 [Desulfobacterales bacterium]|nr:hypothetical protein [Desulfobacterales bacterium]
MANHPLTKFENICARISLNLPPESKWTWDEEAGHALVVFKKDCLELIYIPVSNEFGEEWDFISIAAAPEPVATLAETDCGLIPGQKLFTAYDDEVENIILYATWWPWGDSDSFSLRVGIFCQDKEFIRKDEIKERLTSWLKISDPPAS